MTPMEVAEMAFRLEALQRASEQHDDRLDLVLNRAAIHEEQINGKGGLVNAVAALSKQVESLRNALWGFAASILVGAITVAAALIGHA